MEIMVGLAIGMLATVVIMQVFSVFEAQKRTTTGTADAQTNGSIALYTITRELQMAGWGLHPVSDPADSTPSANAYSALKCATLTVDGIAGFDSAILFPVVINDGGAGASDSITIRYGDSMKGGTPALIGIPAGNPVTVGNNFSCANGDRVLLFDGANCALTTVTALSVPPVNTGITLASPAGATPGVHLSCLGTWNQPTYSVNSVNNVSTLMRSGVANVTDIVNIQAQYGISATVNDNQVVQWVNATGAPWAAPAAADRNRIRAIRIAVVARNSKKETGNVTTACSSTTAAAPTGLCAWDATSALPTPLVAPFVASPAPTITVANDPDGGSWQRYRYRVFETIIPLRNLIWTRSTL